MEKKFIATLALLCVLAFLNVESHSYSRHRSCEVKHCKYPQVLKRKTCQCQCPPELNASSCINWQEWDDDYCECYCPYSRNHKCSANKVWNYKKCNCDSTTTTTTKASVITISTQTPTQAPTQAPTTTPPVICSYGTKVYNNESSIDGIVAGFAVDATTAYVGITEVNGIFIPGTLMLNNSALPGLSYIYNNSIHVSQTSNVFYLTQTPGCNCQFFDKNATLPANSYIVTLNNGTNAFGIGTTDDAGRDFNINATVVGSVIDGFLHYFNGYLPDASTTNYKILVCGSESVMPATTTVTPMTTTINGNNSTTSTDSYEKRIDDSVNAFTNAAMDAVQSLFNIINLKNEMVSIAQNIISNDSTTTQAEAFVYQTFLNLVNNTVARRRRKRQTIDTCQNATQQVEIASNAVTSIETNYNQLTNLTMQLYYVKQSTPNFTLRPEVLDKYKQFLAEMRNLTVQKNECKKHLTELTAIRDEVCSQTTTTSTTAAPVVCSYSWSPYAGNNLPPSDAFYVGKNPYGHDIYVGAGTGNGDLAPGSLEPAYLNGVTMETSFVVYNVTNNVTYLAIPSTCRCQWLPTGNLYSMPALVRLRSYYWIGRHNFSDGSFEVGKVYDLGYGITMSHPENNQEIQSTVFDVLQCATSS